MSVLITLMVVTVSLYIHVSNHHAVNLKYVWLLMFQLYLNKFGGKNKKSFVDGLNNRRSESEKTYQVLY